MKRSTDRRRATAVLATLALAASGSAAVPAVAAGAAEPGAVTGTTSTALTGVGLQATVGTQAVTTVTGTLVKTHATSTWSPPSPDPSGITYLPGSERLLVSDGEVDEMPIYTGANLFTVALSATMSVTSTGTTLSPSLWSDEPTGLGYNPDNGHLFVSDDQLKTVFEIASPGGDGAFGTSDDGARTSFKTSTFGSVDPEGVDYDSKRDEVLISDGLSRELFRVNPGPDGLFNGIAPTGDDLVTHVDLEKVGIVDPEGVAYDSERDTVVLVDKAAIWELDENGSLLDKANISQVAIRNPAGITIAPASDGSSGLHYYVTDRGVDNDTDPAENDGRIFEISAALPEITNRPPAVDAGADQILDVGETAQLSGIVKDDGKPDGSTVTYQWSKVSGPGTVGFADASSAATTATFSVSGAYVLRLTASDGELIGSDEVALSVYEAGETRTVTLPVVASSDDAVEGTATGGDRVNLAQADIELGENEASGTRFPVTTGLRFANVPVPRGGEVVSAKIKFLVDGGGADQAILNIRGEASPNASTYLAQGGDITSRPSTAATVQWTPPAWTAGGSPQLTPELKGVLQEIVNLPNWAKGNAAAFMISGTGRRTAGSYEGKGPARLELQYVTVATINQAPVVSAGADQAVTLPATAALDGTVSDDGKPFGATVTRKWSKVSGPGTVTFKDANMEDTTAWFSAAGTYTLRLTASDSTLTASDDIVVTVTGDPGDAVTMTTSAERVVVGKTVRLTGSAPELSGTGTVEVWVQRATKSVEDKLGVATATVDGSFVVEDQPRVTSTYYAKVGETSSAPVRVAVAPKLTARLTRTLVPVGARSVVTGTLSPSATGQPVRLQRFTSSGWTTVKSTTLTAGSGVGYRFSVRHTSSGVHRYRVVTPAYAGRVSAIAPGASLALRLRVYRAEITRVRAAGDEFVAVKNTGRVSVPLLGWRLRNQDTGRSVTLKSFTLRPGSVVRVHTGSGTTDGNDLFLASRTDMWGRHATVVLRDALGLLADRYRY